MSAADLADHKLKLVIMGGGGVGKSALTIQYTSNVFMGKYNPTIEETYTKNITVDENPFVLEIVDTAGTEQFAAMRDLYIKTGHGFMLVFSLVMQTTITDVSKMQSQIVKVKDSQDVPMILVGNKCDLEDKREVTTADGQAHADKWTHGKYIEASAKSMFNVEKCFIDCVKEIIHYHPELQQTQRRRDRSCTLF